MISLAFVLLWGMHAPRLQTPDPAGNCPVAVTGRLIVPPYAAPIPAVSVEASQLDYPYGGKTVLSGPDGIFNFGYLPSAQRYSLDVHGVPGMEGVRQAFYIQADHGSKCIPGPGIRLDILLHPSAKPEEVVEDTIGIENLAAPGNYAVNLELGFQYKKEGQKENASKTFEHALEINSGSMLSRAALGEYSFQAGDCEKAAELLEGATRLGNVSASVYYMLGSCYYKLDHLDLAEASLLRALDIEPTIGRPYLQLFNVYLKAQMPEKALKAAQTYLERYPDAGDREYVQSLIDKLSKALKPNQPFGR